MLVALHQQQVAGRDALDLLFQRRFRLPAQLVHDDPALLGHDHHLAAAGFAVAVRVLPGMVDIEAMVCVLDQRHFQSPLYEARDELLDQRGLAASRPSGESEYFHAESSHRTVPAKASLYQGVIPVRI